MHPLAAQRLEQLPDADLTDDNIRAAIWLGAPFKVMEASPNRFRIEVARRLINDSFLPSLTQRLEKLDRASFDTTNFVQSAAAKTPLPDDHSAAALWWRILGESPEPLPDNSPQTTPAAARLNAKKPRREPPRAPRTTSSTIRPSRAEPALMIARCRHRDLARILQ
jgi:hypothetical protein